MSEKDDAIGQQHIFGNFRNYYTFHPVSSRVDLLPAGCFNTMWSTTCSASSGEADTFRMCDVGCNEGDLTLALYQKARSELPPSVAILMLGVDIDGTLIERARVKTTTFGVSEGDSVSFYAADVMSEGGSLPFTIGDGARFNFVSLYSITLWIHINCGTTGLIKFIYSMCNLTSDYLLVEPQHKKSYHTASKRCRKLGISPPPFASRIPSQELDRIEEFIAETVRSSKPSDGRPFVSEVCLGKEAWQGRAIFIFSRSPSCV